MNTGIDILIWDLKRQAMDPWAWWIYTQTGDVWLLPGFVFAAPDKNGMIDVIIKGEVVRRIPESEISNWAGWRPGKEL